MEGIVCWVLAIQLAIGPFVFGSEFIRGVTTPPQVVKLSELEVTTLTDHKTGEVIQFTEIPKIEDSVIDVACENIGGIIFAPASLLCQFSLPIAQAFDEILEGYLCLLEFQERYVIESEHLADETPSQASIK